MTYTETVTTPLDFADTVEAVRVALADQGFGVLTEIDIAATLREKVDADLEPYVILGACNPGLAQRAIAIDASIGAFLPCNVVVRVADEGTVVDALDPGMMSTLTENAALEPIATEARERILAVLAALPTS